MVSLFFVPDLGTGASIVVEGDVAHHAIKVLRVQMSEELLLADGSGAWARGRVETISKKSFTVHVIERGIATEISPELIVIQALMKSAMLKSFGK